MYEMCFLGFLIGKFVCFYFRLLCQQLEQPVLLCCPCHITDLLKYIIDLRCFIEKFKRVSKLVKVLISTTSLLVTAFENC